MHLDDYFKQEGALTVDTLSAAIGVKDPAQVRQWRNTNNTRAPGPAYCPAIVKATGGLVREWDLRPKDWFRVWPKLIGTKGAPDVPADAMPPAAEPQPAVIVTPLELHGDLKARPGDLPDPRPGARKAIDSNSVIGMLENRLVSPLDGPRNRRAKPRGVAQKASV